MSQSYNWYVITREGNDDMIAGGMMQILGALDGSNCQLRRRRVPSY